MKTIWQRMREAGAAASAPALARGQTGGGVDNGAKSGSGDGDADDTPCPTCSGTGVDDGEVCGTCNGSGSVMREAAPAPDTKTCPTCDGSGKILGGSRACPDCKGSGKVPSDWTKTKETEPSLIERLTALEEDVRPMRALREAKPASMGAVYSTPTRVKSSSGDEGYKVVLIREGRGNSEDDRWYTADAIREMCEAGVAEGMQAYADHPDLEEEEIRPERSVKHLVGHYRDVAFAESGGSPRAEAVFVPMTLDEAHPTYGWVVTLAEAATNNTGPQPLAGISLYGLSAGDYGERPDGSEGMIATLIRPTSGDIVTNAGAGGGFVRRLMESARAARLRKTTREEQPMKVAEYQSKLKEATKRLREADSDEARTEAMAELAKLEEVEIDAPLKPLDTVEALTEAAPALVEKIRESAAKEATDDKKTVEEQLAETQGLLKEAQGNLSQFTEVIDISGALREAGVEDEVEMRHFVLQARKLGLREAADLKDMVETERAYNKAQEDRLAEKMRESFDLDLEVEGNFGRTPEPAGDGGVASLRESGIPTRTAA